MAEGAALDHSPLRPPSLRLPVCKGDDKEQQEQQRAAIPPVLSADGAGIVEGERSFNNPSLSLLRRQASMGSTLSPTSSSRARASIATLSLRHQCKLLVSPRDLSWRQQASASAAASAASSPLSSPGAYDSGKRASGGDLSGSLAVHPSKPSIQIAIVPDHTHAGAIREEGAGAHSITPRLFTFGSLPPSSPLHAPSINDTSTSSSTSHGQQQPAASRAGTPRRGRPADIKVEHILLSYDAAPELHRSLSSAALAGSTFLPTLAGAAAAAAAVERGKDDDTSSTMHVADDGSLRLGGFDIGVGCGNGNNFPSSPAASASSHNNRTPRLSLAASAAASWAGADADNGGGLPMEDASASSLASQQQQQGGGRGNLIVVGRLGTCKCCLLALLLLGSVRRRTS